MNKSGHSRPAAEGEQEIANTKLFPLVYEQLRQLAAAKLSHENGPQTLQPTALVHEAWLRLGGEDQSRWQNQNHFLAAAAEAMRRILIDRARRRSRLRHGGGLERVELATEQISAEISNDRLLAIDEALDQLRQENPENAQVVVLKFFGGLTNSQVGQVLGVNERTVERKWAFAKVWLMRFIQQQT